MIAISILIWRFYLLDILLKYERYKKKRDESYKKEKGKITSKKEMIATKRKMEVFRPINQGFLLSQLGNWSVNMLG